MCALGRRNKTPLLDSSLIYIPPLLCQRPAPPSRFAWTQLRERRVSSVSCIILFPSFSFFTLSLSFFFLHISETLAFIWRRRAQNHFRHLLWHHGVVHLREQVKKGVGVWKCHFFFLVFDVCFLFCFFLRFPSLLSPNLLLFLSVSERVSNREVRNNEGDDTSIYRWGECKAT